MPPDAISEAIEAVKEEAHAAAAEAAEAAVEAAEARAEAAEEAADLLAEAGLRDQISARVDALRQEHDRCHADHESRLNGLASSHESLKGLIETLQAEAREMATRLPVVVPLSTSPTSPLPTAEAEAEASPAGAVVIPAAAEAAEAVPVALGGRKRKGTFL